MKKLGGLDPFTLVLLLLLVLCAGALGLEGLRRVHRPAPQPSAPASAPAPAEQPKPEVPAEKPAPSNARYNG